MTAADLQYMLPRVVGAALLYAVLVTALAREGRARLAWAVAVMVGGGLATWVSVVAVREIPADVIAPWRLAVSYALELVAPALVGAATAVRLARRPVGAAWHVAAVLLATVVVFVLAFVAGSLLVPTMVNAVQ